MAGMRQDFFEPGNLAKDGFLGSDRRSIEEIIRSDREMLQRCGTDNEKIAEVLNRIMDGGKERLESKVEIEGTMVFVRWDRGMLACPFGEPGLHPKMSAEMTIPPAGKTVRFSRLSVHLIKKHGFFGGKGSPFRLEPDELVRLIH
jgi:hypothetical protein